MTEPTTAPEMEQAPVRRRRRKRRSSTRSRPRPHTRVRALYFCFAGLWGFSAASAALLGALSLLGRRVEPSTTVFLALGLSAIASLAGGAVLARAYGRASHRD